MDLTRRSVLGVAAWSIPVVAVAVAAPAAAASTGAGAIAAWTSASQADGRIAGTFTVTTSGSPIDDAVVTLSTDNGSLLFYWSRETSGPPGWNRTAAPFQGEPYYPSRSVAFTAPAPIAAGSVLMFTITGTIPSGMGTAYDAIGTFSASGVTASARQTFGPA